jgi:CRP/FNR family cyclic AMP-dependent transcriptional regulator
MEPMPHRYRRQLESTSWFCGLPVELQDCLMKTPPVPAEERASAISVWRALLLLVRSARRCSRDGTVGVDGKEALLAVLGRTAWVGEVPKFDGLSRAHDVIAVSRACAASAGGHATQSAGRAAESSPSD